MLHRANTTVFEGNANAPVNYSSNAASSTGLHAKAGREAGRGYAEGRRPPPPQTATATARRKSERRLRWTSGSRSKVLLAVHDHHPCLFLPRATYGRIYLSSVLLRRPRGWLARGLKRTLYFYCFACPSTNADGSSHEQPINKNIYQRKMARTNQDVDQPLVKILTI